MPPKSRPPQPIDRPLSRAALRDFAGWSTAYPPGVSEPNTLRVMENVMITRDGSARVRPALRSLLRTRSPYPLVGSHELFYTETGKAYLVAVREETAVTFRVIATPEGSEHPVMMTLEEAGFALSGDPESVSFSTDTTYVRYLQIDNKIFALSNTDDPLIMFWVGSERRAKRPASIERPDWTAADRLSVIHPDAGWILGSTPVSTRRNLATNPDFEASRNFWVNGNTSTRSWHSTAHYLGARSLGFTSVEERTNLCTRPLGDVATYGIAGWEPGPRCFAVTADGASMKIRLDKQPSSENGFAMSQRFSVEGGARYKVAFDLTDSANVRRWEVAVRYFKSNGDRIGETERIGGNTNLTPGRKYSQEFVTPSQARSMRILIGGFSTDSGVIPLLHVNDVYLGAPSNSSRLHGGQGTNYFWTGTPNASTSVYHPPKDIVVNLSAVSGSAGSYFASAHVYSGAARTVNVIARARNASGAVVASRSGSATSPVGTWTRHDTGSALAAPSTTVTVDMQVVVRQVPRGENHFVDAVLLERASALGDYFSGSWPASTALLKHRWLGTRHESQSVQETFDPAGSGVPPKETAAANTLVSSDSSKNTYSVLMFYTISNELGESAASQPTTIRVQRPWTAWQWNKPDAAGAPAGAVTDDPLLVADQLAAIMPESVFDDAIAAGATHWNVYFTTWGPEDVPPVTALTLVTIPLSAESQHEVRGWTRLTPKLVAVGPNDPLIPTEGTRVNATSPLRGSQGIVAADRLVLVGNPSDPARIDWSSGYPGDYHDFSPALGGGTKQLTSGNLFTAAAVKLWQNPQSVDTLTILTKGDDGRSNAYYMQPATITSLSESISVMGFEETTATLGTISSYGCEVLNNALYHPLDHALIKSTANNYNISHRSMTETIENMWTILQSPQRIVSSQLDQRLYYLVHNRTGDPLEPGCWGNELWVCDIAAKTPTWSRWKVQGISLRSIEIDDVVMMSVVHPEGIFALDPRRANDEVFTDAGTIAFANIGWRLETNTQGANRAHDAWANLQQLNIRVGNFEGQMRYGVRGHDAHGMPVDVSKVLVATNPPIDGITDEAELDTYSPPLFTFDREDYLLVRKTMREWTFYAESVTDLVTLYSGDDDNEVEIPRFCSGQIDYVTYRYTPVSVNVGYEFGSVETFEYGSSALAEATTDSGVPKPYIDVARP